MKASELRIGNYVESSGGWPLRSVNAHGLSTILNEIESYKPIPLTEDWLLKFGFEISDYYKNYYNGVCSVKYDGDREFILSKDESDANCYTIDAEIKYVHQLQNLYHALTGEELTIKL